MGRQKRVSTVLQEAEKKLAVMRSLDAKLDLGGGVSVAGLEKMSTSLARSVAAYNKSNADADGHLGRIMDLERTMRDYNGRVLPGVATRYGKDSVEYRQAGGTRSNERAKRGTGKQAQRTAKLKAALEDAGVTNGATKPKAGQPAAPTTANAQSTSSQSSSSNGTSNETANGASNGAANGHSTNGVTAQP